MPVGLGFTPTSALVTALQAQGPNIEPRAPLFFGVRPACRSFADDVPGEMVMLQVPGAGGGGVAWVLGGVLCLP